jgi:hypothetical protein
MIMSRILENNEMLYSFCDAYEKITGRRPVLSVPWRHSQFGIKGIKLEFVIVGGKRMTSLESVRRFFEARTQQVMNGSTYQATSSTGQSNRTDFERAEKEIDMLTQTARKGRKKKVVVAVA